MLNKLVKYHIIPFVLALLICGISLYFLKDSANKKVIISGVQLKTSGKYSNLLSGEQAEIDFLASIKNKNQLTLFGSSEFTGSAYCPYNFFPDSLGIQMLGIGHAYHQNLSILIELLAANEFVENSDICFFISPGWFGTQGTNTEAFLEFAKPNFLSKIISDSTIDIKYKDYIGEYIYKNLDEFEGFSNEMEILKDNYLFKKATFISKSKLFISNLIKSKSGPAYAKKNVTYKIENQTINKKHWNLNMDSIAKIVKSDFIASISSNSIFVYDDYYNTYLLNDDSTYIQGRLSEPKTTNNVEFNDFKLLLSYLNQKKVNASFVIIPYNPYHYLNTEILIPIIDSVSSEINMGIQLQIIMQHQKKNMNLECYKI